MSAALGVVDPRMVDLDALLLTVHDERSFIAFVEALARDFALEQVLGADDPNPYSAGQLGWEHGTVDAVLSAAASWGRIKLHTGQSPPSTNPWQRCAQILHAGKWYE